MMVGLDADITSQGRKSLVVMRQWAEGQFATEMQIEQGNKQDFF